MNNDNNFNLVHWADFTANKIIKEKGDKEVYIVASGVSPSGFAHFGHLREVITTDFVARSLIKMGKKVRFLYSWDDFDTFRKVPGNLPNQEMLKDNLFKSLRNVPDPFEKEDCLAETIETSFESELNSVGIDYIDFIRQGDMYPKGKYNKGLKTAVENRLKIKEILDEWRKEKLSEDYLPVNIYCEKCGKDRTTNTGIDGDNIKYHCDSCGFDGVEDLNTSIRSKLPWKVDWPMRWAYEKVDFEPGGKDHSTQGSSYTVGKEIVKIFDWTAPLYIPYDFVNLKGETSKISSSGDKVLTISDMIKVYSPEMLRWLFASYKNNQQFDIAFDLDVIKNYEAFDRMERLAYGLEQANEKKTEMAKRVYELSQLNKEGNTLEEAPFRAGFRHLCNILQINGLDIEKAKSFYKDEFKNKNDENLFEQRAKRAIFWIENYAPDDFKFLLNTEKRNDIELSSKDNEFISEFKELVSNTWNTILSNSDRDFQNQIGNLMEKHELDSSQTYAKLY